jgi:phytoene dehydrogenase-like protein
LGITTKRRPVLPDFEYDAIVVGSGPNGLAAAITIAREKRSVLLLEAGETIGGGIRTKELTLPGFRHDVCAAIHPLALASPFFRSLDLERFGLEWIHPAVPLAHPLDSDSAVLLKRSLDETAQGLGRDGDSYRRHLGLLVRHWEWLVGDLLKPLGLPGHPFMALRFALKGLQSSRSLADRWFKDIRARALFAGNSCHSILPLEDMSSGAFGIMLSMMGHAVGWPLAKGGSQALAKALASCFLSLGGEIVLNRQVASMKDLPRAQVVMFDVSPRNLDKIVGDVFPASYRERLQEHRHGPGAFKVDWALAGPIPWKDPACLKAGTVHCGGTFEEIAASEQQVWQGLAPERPFVLLSQPSLFDSERAPEGEHTAWAYCHVPNGCDVDMTRAIEDQVERFAPGFKKLIKAKHTLSPAAMEEYNTNYIGGDIVGGVQDFREIFIRPLGRWRAYSTPARGYYLCSASMPPGGGVHGMCGHLAARKALKEILGF